MVRHHQPTTTLGDSHRAGVLATDEPMKVKKPLEVNQLKLYQTELTQFIIIVCKHVLDIFIITCLNHLLKAHLKLSIIDKNKSSSIRQPSYDQKELRP